MRKFIEGPLCNYNVSRQSSTGLTHRNRGGRDLFSSTWKAKCWMAHNIDHISFHPQYHAERKVKSKGSLARESKHLNGSRQAWSRRSSMKPVSMGVEYVDLHILL